MKFPTRLYSRAALIVLFPITGLLVVGSIVFIQRHYEDVTRQMSNHIVLDLNYLQTEIDTAETAQAAQQVIDKLASSLQLNSEFTDRTPPPEDQLYFYDLSGRVIIETLRRWYPGIAAIDLVADRHRVHVWMPSAQGPLVVSFARSRVSASNPHQFLVLMFFSGIIMALVTFVFLRNQLHPIRSLAKAADAFGKGKVTYYRPSGATEIRMAGNAFLNMRQRIERHVEQRTNILSGVSHDLRTPLTRLKLGLTMLDDSEDVTELLQDVNDMELLLEEFLSFVRDGAQGEVEDFDPVQVVRDGVEKASRSNDRVVLNTVQGACTIRGRPLSLTRALNNLITNALKYGTQAQVGVAVAEDGVFITVEDDGPGIAADQRSDAMEPFVRLDPARNQNKRAGAGLGLAITNDIVRQHGGSMNLSHSVSLGGLKATLMLPR